MNLNRPCPFQPDTQPIPGAAGNKPPLVRPVPCQGVRLFAHSVKQDVTYGASAHLNVIPGRSGEHFFKQGEILAL